MPLEVLHVFAVEDELGLAEGADGHEAGAAVAVDVVEELPQVPATALHGLQIEIQGQT